MTIPIEWYLILSSALFIIGAAGVMLRRNLFIILFSIELMMNAVNVNLVGFSRVHENLIGQNFVLFTNYQFYVDEFETYAREALADPATGYSAFVATGNQIISRRCNEPIRASATNQRVPIASAVNSIHSRPTIQVVGVSLIFR